MSATQRSWEAPSAVCPTCGEPFWDSEVTHCPEDGTPLHASAGGPETMVERVVGGRYRLLGLVGEGGMGTVYAAEHAVSLRRVALKIIKPELESSSVARGRFLRECELLERINSPYVVEVLEAGESKHGEIFLVMELLEGVSLGDRLETIGALPAAEALRIAIQITHALAAAHAEGIVHRDLKPDNIFLCEDGTVRVLDFGIARLLDGVTLDAGSRKLTATGTIVGTPAYISPEGAAGGFIGPAADLYSLGVVLYEMIAGELPFWDSHPVLMMGMHLKEPPPRLSELPLDLPLELIDLVDELLAKKPEARPATADDVLGRLEALRGADGTLVMDAVGAVDTFPTVPAGRRGLPRAKLLAAAGAALIVGVALTAGALWWASGEADRTPDARVEPEPSESALGEPESPAVPEPTGSEADDSELAAIEPLVLDAPPGPGGAAPVEAPPEDEPSGDPPEAPPDQAATGEQEAPPPSVPETRRAPPTPSTVTGRRGRARRSARSRPPTIRPPTPEPLPERLVVPTRPAPRDPPRPASPDGMIRDYY